MIQRMLYRKILVATSLLIVLLMLYLIPENKNNIKFIETNVSYTYPNDLMVVYLLDSNNYVSRMVMPVDSSSEEMLVYELLDTLTIGGKRENKIPNGFRGLIPSNVSTNKIELKDGILTIDFSHEFLELERDIEEKTIEAIIYTLTSIKGIDKINILVDGNKLTNLPNSGKLLPEFLDRSYGINKEYNLVSLNDVDSYIVYYVSSVNGTNYYIPVTKYVNDREHDKIRVIINELASSYISETNLSSYLSSNIKLLDYEIDEDIIKLNFSKEIFSDITSNNILEEVIYTISLSIMDNIPIDEVIFMVEGNIICQSSNIIG